MTEGRTFRRPPSSPGHEWMDPAGPRPTAPAGFYFFLMQAPARQDLRRSRPARICLFYRTGWNRNPNKRGPVADAVKPPPGDAASRPD